MTSARARTTTPTQACDVHARPATLPNTDEPR